MSVGTEVSVEDLISKIEEVHGKTWSIWCTYDGKYVIQIGGPDKPECIGPSDNIRGLLGEAVKFRKLPKYPRQPGPVPSRDRYTSAKDGTRWHLLFDRTCFIGAYKTKKECELTADARVANAHRQRDQWSDVIGPLIAGKTEGVDFAWED